MNNKTRGFIYTIDTIVSVLVINVMPRLMALVILCGTLSTTAVFAQSSGPFKASSMIQIGDNVKYGSYIIYKIGEGVYKINDPGTTTGSGGAFGVDMYLIRGEKKALIIDTGNDYINGKVGNGIPPREYAKEEFLDIVHGLAPSLPLDIAFTHGHGDHTGMTGAFIDQKNVTAWNSVGPPAEEEVSKKQPREGEPVIIDPTVYLPFTPGEKTFDLGGGRIVETYLVRGHSNNGTVYIMKNDLLLFTGDALGSGFGQGFKSVQTLKDFAADIPKFVDYISAIFTPYERYALRVYTGHTWQNVFNGYYTPNMEKVDMGYLDWRFVQNVSSCAKGIIGGKWLVDGSGLVHVTNMTPAAFWEKTEGWAIMVYGIGAILMPIELVYESAGLMMPK